MLRFYRFIALILILLMAVGVMASCDFQEVIGELTEQQKGLPEDDRYDYIEIPQPGFAYSSSYTPVKSRYSYEALNDAQKALYSGLEENMYAVSSEKDDQQQYGLRQVIVDGYCLSTADIRVALKAFNDDNPYVFWLSGTCVRLYVESDGYTAVRCYSEFSPDEIMRMQTQLDEALSEFFSSVEPGLSEYERDKYTHDYLIDLCEYDEEAAQAHTHEEKIVEAFVPYGALVRRLAVCEGYGRAFQLMMNGLGMECVSVTGIGFVDDEQELHLWNAVQIGGSWYNVDTTWDDQEDSYFRYEYFNVNDELLYQDHQPSELASHLTEDELNGEETYGSVALNLFIPECTDTDYEYYIFECPHLTDFDGYVVTEALSDAALSVERYFTVYIEPEYMDYDNAVDLLFKDAPQYFFIYVRDVNERLYDYEIDNSNLTYYVNKKRSIVTVELNYY